MKMKLQSALQVRVLPLWKNVDLYFLGSDQSYGASPARTILGETCKMLVDIETGRQVTLSGLCLLEIKILAEGNLEPLASVTGVHVAQIQLHEECAQAKFVFFNPMFQRVRNQSTF